MEYIAYVTYIDSYILLVGFATSFYTMISGDTFRNPHFSMSKPSTRAWFAFLAAILNIGLPIGFAMSIVYGYIKLQLIFLTLIPLCNSAIYICTSMIGGFALQPRMGGYIWFLACGVLFIVLARAEGVRICYPGLGILYIFTGLIGIGSLIYDLKANEEEGEDDGGEDSRDERVLKSEQNETNVNKFVRDLELQKIEHNQKSTNIENELPGGRVWVQPGNDELIMNRDKPLERNDDITSNKEEPRELTPQPSKEDGNPEISDPNLIEQKPSYDPEESLSILEKAEGSTDDLLQFNERVKKLQSGSFNRPFDPFEL